MISKSAIEKIVSDVITGHNAFLVEVTVSRDNRIKILIDKKEGLTIDDCVQVSRYVEQTLNRDSEDFELEVSSPGLSEPLKVREQYEKNTGRIVEVITNNGNKIKGELLEVLENEISIKESKRIKVEGSKKKKNITEIIPVAFDNIKSTLVTISFK